MSSSTSPPTSSTFTPLPTPELRSGNLTRFGNAAVLGDSVTELALSGLVEEARTAARSQGYAVGWGEGRRAAAAEAALARRSAEQEHAAERAVWRARQDEAVRALTRAAEELARATEEAQALVRGQALELARELTETLVGHELRAAPDTAADVAARVLAQSPADTPFVVRLHPDVVADAQATELARAGVRLVPDARLDRSDAVIEVDDHVVDLRVRTALERVREVLA
jgi:flagellar assembly protein FliH